MEKASLCVAWILGVSFGVQAGIENAPIETGPDRNPSPLRVDFRRIGTLRPRSSREIKSSPFMIDCGTMDRDMVDFEEVKDYLEPLGAKEIRLQAGWAKTEKVPGKIDFAWLDRIVDWALARDIAIYMETSYGNPIYPGAGGMHLSAGIPNSDEGLAAWDRWIEALATHYKGRVWDWAMWNEPDCGWPYLNPASRIGEFNVRTAKIIKRIIPGARLNGLSLANHEPSQTTYWQHVDALGKDVDLFDTLVTHLYSPNPDWDYPNIIVPRKEMLAKYAPKSVLRQGESGAPSDWLEELGLRKHAWSESTQAKWDMRRMIGDVAHGHLSCVFQICDMVYNDEKFHRINRKGLLRANWKHQVIQVKKAYYAVQNVLSVFDDTVKTNGAEALETLDRTISSYGFLKDGKWPILAFWQHGDLIRVDGELQLDKRAYPTESFDTREVAFDWKGCALEDPVWIDLFTGAVYEFPARYQIRHSDGVTFVRVPTYDSPCLLTERAAILLDK